MSHAAQRAFFAEVKEQIRRKIILPFQKPGLFQRFKKRAGGGIRSTGSAAVTPSHELQTYYSPATPDPYAARVIPSFSGCNATNCASV